MPGGTRNDPANSRNDLENSEISTAVIGERFMDALNEGLTRSVASRAYALPGRPTGGGELPDPYTAPVLRGFAACLTAALAPEDRCGNPR
jgi:hypothetical protein